MFPLEVVTVLLNANVLPNALLVRYKSKVAGSPEVVVQEVFNGLEEYT